MTMSGDNNDYVGPVLAGKTVCVITQTEGFGGTEVHTLELLARLLREGFLVELLECGLNRYDDAIRTRGLGDRVTVRHTQLRVNETGKALDSWRALLSTLDRDVLIFPMGCHALASLGFLRTCRELFAKVILIEHLEAVPSRKYPHLEWLASLWRLRRRWQERARAHCADVIIAVSDRVRDRLVLDYAHPPSKVLVVHNGVRSAEFQRNPGRGREFRIRHRIPEAAFVYGMITRLDPVKGIDLALGAFHSVLCAGTARDACLVIAGDGPHGPDLEQEARRLGIAENVRFVGFVDPPQNALAAFDVIMFSSRSEGLPLGLLEAMASGCVPIVTSIGGMPEVVDDPSIGWVVAPENSHALGQAMSSALTLDGSEFSAMARAARLRVQNSFDLDASHSRFLDVCGL